MPWYFRSKKKAGHIKKQCRHDMIRYFWDDAFTRRKFSILFLRVWSTLQVRRLADIRCSEPKLEASWNAIMPRQKASWATKKSLIGHGIASKMSLINSQSVAPLLLNCGCLLTQQHIRAEISTACSNTKGRCRTIKNSLEIIVAQGVKYRNRRGGDGSAWCYKSLLSLGSNSQPPHPKKRPHRPQILIAHKSSFDRYCKMYAPLAEFQESVKIHAPECMIIVPHTRLSPLDLPRQIIIIRVWR